MKKNLRFKQLRLNQINNQERNKKQKKEHLRLVIGSIKVHVVTKTDDVL